MTTPRQHLSASGLLSTIRQRFTSIPDGRTGTPSICLPDALMSGLAVFGLKCPSLLQFDPQRRDPIVEYNLHTLYGVEQVPCDTQLRTILDPVDPRYLRPAFKAVFALLWEARLDGRFWGMGTLLEGMKRSTDALEPGAGTRKQSPERDRTLSWRVRHQ